MKHDILQLTGLGSGNTQRVEIVRGSFQPHEGHISFKRVGDEEGAREFVAVHSLERWRFIDHSRSSR